MKYTFNLEDGGYLVFADNRTETYNLSSIMSNALMEKANFQILLKRELSALESARFIKTLTGINYQVVDDVLV